MTSNSNRHLLLSSVGTSGPRETRYVLGSRPTTACFSAFGLWQLLVASDRPTEIWFLLTPKARATQWEAIREEAERLGVETRPVDLSGDMDDTREFLEQTAKEIPEGCRLTLDVTQGLRHHAFLFYALAIYLSGFRNVRIDGVWYCRLETENRDDPKPLIDLKPTLELAHWFHALAVFREQGVTVPMVALIEREVESTRQTARERGNDGSLHREASELEAYARAFNQFGFAYSSGLPLELGKVSHWVAANAAQFPQSKTGASLPLAGAVADLIKEQSKRTAFGQPAQSGGKWKSEIELTEEELARQAALIDAYLDRCQFAVAVGLMREWVISWLMWRSGKTTDWLPYGNRKSFEQRLGGMLALIRADSPPVAVDLSADQRAFVTFWSQVSDSLRNTFHHHGMRDESLEKPPSQIEEVKAFWNRLKQNKINLPEFGGGQGKLLICPIGLTPGVLYSALKNTTPDRVIVICSEQSRPKIDEAITQAGSQAKTTTLLLKDTYTGIDEFAGLVNKASLWLFEADEILANLTGGTTLMGALVGELAKRAAREYQRPVYEFVLIDKRPHEEQRNDPWQLGKIHYLDGEPVNDSADGQDGPDPSEETN